MPAFMLANARQLPIRSANLTRMVTKVRFMVECVNGHLKKWQWLANVICNQMIPVIGDCFRIIGAVLNW